MVVGGPCSAWEWKLILPGAKDALQPFEPFPFLRDYPIEVHISSDSFWNAGFSVGLGGGCLLTCLGKCRVIDLNHREVSTYICEGAWVYSNQREGKAWKLRWELASTISFSESEPQGYVPKGRTQQKSGG